MANNENASKPEPQAQAGEPEVVAETVADVTNTGYVYVRALVENIPFKTKFITLQSHREAMEKETAAATNAIRRLSDELFQKEEAIAKKDAALKVCVEAKDVLDALESGEWAISRHMPQECLTDEANAEHAWSVHRLAPPTCTEEGIRFWFGSTAFEALRRGKNAITQGQEAMQ